MPPNSFIEYARSPNLSADEIYTLELLIDKARSEFDPRYWDDWMERNDAREQPDYPPSFSPDDVEPAWRCLAEMEWVSFHRSRTGKRPVRNIHAVRFLTEITGLILDDNEVADLEPLAGCKKLKRLGLAQTPAVDLNPLVGCVSLQWLDLKGIAASDWAVLQNLPELRWLQISGCQVSALERLENLPTVRKIDFDDVKFESFRGFPEIPNLRVIWGAKVSSLDGLQRFSAIDNIINLSGPVPSLEPLRTLRGLTVILIHDSKVTTLEPLSELLALRDLHLHTNAKNLDLSPLERLPALHDVSIKCREREPARLADLRDGLTSWDVEFFSAEARHTPSLSVEVIDQANFEIYDRKQPFGLTEKDGNEGLLSSEFHWLETKLEPVFAIDFEEDTDYTLNCPHQSGGRSRTVVIYSEAAIEAFPKLVLGMQNVLSHSNHDWIIYFQSDIRGEDDFVVWVYPDKIVATEENAKRVLRLIHP